jgi:hypothetical protein
MFPFLSKEDDLSVPSEAFPAKSFGPHRADMPELFLSLTIHTPKPWRNAPKAIAASPGDRPLRNPTTGIACCARRERPRGRRAAEKRNEFTSPHIRTPAQRDSIVSTPKSTLIGLKPGIKTIAAVHRQCRWSARVFRQSVALRSRPHTMSKSRIATPLYYAHVLKELADVHFAKAKTIALHFTTPNARIKLYTLQFDWIGRLRQTRAPNPHTHGFRATSSPSAKRMI